jgi:hypothetical protein
MLLMVTVLAVSIGGLAVVMHQEDRASRIDVGRSEAQIRALELAETGLARAATEVSSLVDSAADGVGNVSATYAGGSYAVTATQNGSDWTLVSTGTVEKSKRRVRRNPTTAFGAAIAAAGAITLSGGLTQSDSYDSRLGTYASQATNTDAWGAYASTSGGIGSNAGISISGARVRGDAIPGSASTTSLSGGAAVTGTTVPRSTPMSLPATPQADFTAALATNDNGSWTSAGGSVTYDAVKKEFVASGGAVVTFPAGTYFFSKFVLSGGSTAKFTGPTKLYDVALFDTSGGTLLNTTGSPSNLVVYAHPYVYAGVTSASPIQVKISGGTGTSLAMYGPTTSVTISGGSSVFGALVANTVTLSGGTYIHYDAALAATAGVLTALQQIYWREATPPLQ